MNAKQIELTDKKYEDILNEAYGDVEICGMKFSSGYALRELDPTAFRCGMADEPEKWECGECNSIYETEEEAKDCCET